jgi:AraC-like DNA-binding protein
VPPGAYATLLRLLTGCADLASAFDGFTRFYRMFDHHPYLRLERRGTLATLSLAPRDRGQAFSIFFTHGLLLTPWRTLAWLSGRELPLRKVVLPARFRAFASETRYLFGCEPDFEGARPSLALPTELLQLPVVRRPEEAEAHSKGSLVHLLLPAPRTTLEGELRALFSMATPLASPTMSQSARHFGVSRAVLARKIREGGLSFQGIKDEVRRDHAIGLLTDTSLTIASIAERVGYSASTAFQRAFRGWTGVSPGVLRRG